MSSLRAFRIQKSRPATSSPSSTASENVPGSSPSKGNGTLAGSNPQDSSQNGNSNHDDDSEDIIRQPAVSLFTKIYRLFTF